MRLIRFGPTAGTRAIIDFAYDSAFYFGRYERELFEPYRRLVRPGVRCFDIGGYRGWTAITFAHLANAPVVVFEPEPANAAFIRRSVAVSGFPIGVDTRLVGASSRDGWVTIDDAASQHGDPAFIKMDIEGGEVDALRGASRVLGGPRPSMVIEIHGADKEEGCVEILASFGYQITKLMPGRGLFSENRGWIYNGWLICAQPADLR